jgi:hypothetical protein
MPLTTALGRLSLSKPLKLAIGGTLLDANRQTEQTPFQVPRHLGVSPSIISNTVKSHT